MELQSFLVRLTSKRSSPLMEIASLPHAYVPDLAEPRVFPLHHKVSLSKVVLDLLSTYMTTYSVPHPSLALCIGLAHGFIHQSQQYFSRGTITIQTFPLPFPPCFLRGRHCPSRASSAERGRKYCSSAKIRLCRICGAPRR